MGKRLLLIRHGQTPLNTLGKIHSVGSKETLTEEGRKQALSLIATCEENAVKIIYTSPEKRAQQTAEIIAEKIHKQIQVLEGLRGRNWGQWQEKSWEEIQHTLEKMNLQSRFTFIPPGGESWKTMEERLKKTIEYIISQPEDSVAVITHEGVLRALLPILKQESKEKSLTCHFDNGSVSIFDYENGVYREVE